MSVLSLIWQLSAAGFVMALPVLLLRPAVRRSLPHIAMPVLWLLVLAVFLIPMDIPSPLNIRRLWSSAFSRKLLTAFQESYRDQGRYGHALHNPAMSFQELALTTVWVTGLIALVRKWIILRLELSRRFKTATLLEGTRYGRYLTGFRRRVRVYASPQHRLSGYLRRPAAEDHPARLPPGHRRQDCRPRTPPRGAARPPL